MQLYIGKEAEKKENTEVRITDITVQDEMGEVQTQQICKFELTQKLVKLPSTNGLKIRLLLNYIPDNNTPDSEPLTIEQELKTSSFINTYGQVAAENPWVYAF